MNRMPVQEQTRASTTATPILHALRQRCMGVPQQSKCLQLTVWNAITNAGNCSLWMPESFCLKRKTNLMVPSYMKMFPNYIMQLYPYIRNRNDATCADIPLQALVTRSTNYATEWVCEQ
jgi:hypothetical protein